MTRARVPCPVCQEQGHNSGFVDGPNGGYFNPRLQCSLCHGKGNLSNVQLDWWQRGRAHYTARVARSESMRECAQRLGVSVVEVSAMEHGRADPSRLEIP